MVSICCSPPDIRPPGRSRMRARLGNSLNSFSSVQTGTPARAACRPTSRFSIDRQFGEDAPLLRHIAQAEARDAIGWQALDALAGEAHFATGRRHQPHDRFHRRRLARAVAAEQRHDLARAHFERDAVQDMGAAVEGVQIGDLQHQCALPR
jgi:hypothetical protein